MKKIKNTIKSFFTILLIALFLSLIFNFKETVNDIKKGIQDGYNNAAKKETVK